MLALVLWEPDSRTLRLSIPDILPIPSLGNSRGAILIVLAHCKMIFAIVVSASVPLS
jgi:hypothetical protein